MENEKLHVDFFMGAICFFFPFVAWMLYAFNAATSPKAAKKCMRISLIPLLIGIVATAVILFINWL